MVVFTSEAELVTSTVSLTSPTSSRASNGGLLLDGEGEPAARELLEAGGLDSQHVSGPAAGR